MPDTSVNIPQNRTDAHYADDVRDMELTPDQITAIARIREAVEQLAAAHQAVDDAVANRRAVLRREWDTLDELGPTRVARIVGHGLTDSTVRGDTTDERARARRMKP